MIELLFSDSAAGSMKIAKSMKHGERYACAVGVIGGTKKEQCEFLKKAKKQQVWTGTDMEGSSQDVEALSLALDIGDISDSQFDSFLDTRKKTIDALMAHFPGAPADAMRETTQKAIARLLSAKTTLEPVRLWICDFDPAELCGLYFVCNFMSDAKTPLSVVHVPYEFEKDSIVYRYRGTGEMRPEEIGALVKYEIPITDVRRKAYSDIWNKLMSENAPLRVVVNGTLMSVPEYFYDFALRNNMPDGEFKVAELIGKTLIQIPGVGDNWLFMRIQSMISSGKLVEVCAETADHPYSGMIKRRDL